MLDLDRIRRDNDLRTIAERDTTLKRVANSGRGEWAGPCPFCGGRDRFRVQPEGGDGGRWLCRYCTDGKWKDVIAYVMRRDGVDFLTACETLGAREERQWTPNPIRPLPSPKPAPSSTWRLNALGVVRFCEAQLWSATGTRAIEWLHKRGLADDTLRRWRIGFNPGKPGARRRIHELEVPCGIVIPCLVDGLPRYIKVRRAEGTPKYTQVKGSHPAPYMLETLKGRDVAVLVEGEFDALLLWQEVGDLTGVVTLGSASEGLDRETWGKRFQVVKHWLLAYDNDSPGQTGAKKIMEALPQARLAPVPKSVPGVKDLTDFYKAGGRLRDWLTFYQGRLGRQLQAPAQPPTQQQEAVKQAA